MLSSRRHRGNRAPGGIRTPNLLIRSQMLYPLSYGRLETSTKCVHAGTIPADHHRRTTRPTTLSAAVSPGTSPQVTGQLYGQLMRVTHSVEVAEATGFEPAVP